MKHGNVAVVQFAERDTPGSIPVILRDRSVPFDVIRVDLGQPIPEVGALAGLVLLGSSLSVDEPAPWKKPVVSAVEQCFEHDVAVIGHCFGGQLMAKILGARVERCPEPEVGWSRIRSTAPSSVPWPSEFIALQWHFDGFSTPRGAVPLWRSDAWENQGFSYGKHIAMQFHIEATLCEVQRWCASNQDLFERPQAGVQALRQLTELAATAVVDQITVAEQIYGAWLASQHGGTADE